MWDSESFSGLRPQALRLMNLYRKLGNALGGYQKPKPQAPLKKITKN
jgi:hypothetical protein